MKGSLDIGRLALRAALEVRDRAGFSRSQPVCVFDLAEKLGLQVRFCPGSSLGGFYAKSSDTILVPALRPSGRQAFTCAHELGHHYFKHGTRLDELEDIDRYQNDSPEEQLVNRFAGYLLMPKWAVMEAFGRRQWDPVTSTPLQIYTVAGQLGVGFETLVNHLRWSMRLISESRHNELLKTTPKQLRREALGDNNVRHLIIADQAWTNVAIDLQVGDAAILPTATQVEGQNVAVVNSGKSGIQIRAMSPGRGRAETSDGTWAAYIRVCRKDFVGLNCYRHEEDPDVDTSTTIDH